MDLTVAIISIVILVFSAILHEIAHGFVAEKLGDPTARLLGRLTLDPRKHIDPFMSLILPLLLILSNSPVIFGAAKPVPVDPFNLKEGRKDLALVALAGPLTNLVIAIIASLIIKAAYLLISSPVNVGGEIVPVMYVLQLIVRLNLLLAIFNLIPIPPLDGSKIVAMFLPEKEARAYMSLSFIGIFIIFFLIAFPIGGFDLGSIIFNLVSLAQNLLGV
jgi:Zn-dependent protease